MARRPHPGCFLLLFTAVPVIGAVSGCGGVPPTLVEQVREREEEAWGDRTGELVLLRDYVDLGRRDLAADWLRRLREADPRDPTLWFEDVHLRAGGGRLESALACLEGLLELQPSEPDYRYERGVLLAGLGREEEAAQAFRGLQESHPGEWRAYVAEAALLMQRGEEGDLARAEDSLARCPEVPAAATAVLFHQGLAAELGGRWEEAGHRYQGLLEQHPGHVDARRNLALVRDRQGRRAEALSHLEVCYALTPAEDVGLRRLLMDRIQEWRAELGGGTVPGSEQAPESASAHSSTNDQGLDP